MASSPQLQRAPNGRLLLLQEDGPVPVDLRRCFPWAAPSAWISLRDKEGAEKLLVRDLADLDPASRACLEAELADSGMTFAITTVLECRKELELRCWEVDTHQGHRSFQTELDEWPRSLPGGGVLIRDICGDLYTVADPEALDPKSRKLLDALLD